MRQIALTHLALLFYHHTHFLRLHFEHQHILGAQQHSIEINNLIDPHNNSSASSETQSQSLYYEKPCRFCVFQSAFLHFSILRRYRHHLWYSSNSSRAISQTTSNAFTFAIKLRICRGRPIIPRHTTKWQERTPRRRRLVRSTRSCPSRERPRWMREIVISIWSAFIAFLYWLYITCDSGNAH